MAFRRFLNIKRPFPKLYIPDAPFTVAQFNILAGSLGATQYFPHTCPQKLAWENRRHTLLAEVKSCLLGPPETKYLPDIFCLEELDNYWCFFKEELSKIGYDSVYMERPSVHVSSWTGKKKYDGCGIFYKRNIFDIVDEQSVTYTDKHDRIALIILLRFKKNHRHLLVGNTHIYWNHRAIQEQLKELGEFDSAITEMKLNYSNQFSDPDIPVVVCGDFNNGPQSEVYKYMSQEFLQGAGCRMRSAYDIYKLRKGPSDEIILTEESPFGAAYEPDFTSVNFKRCWTIDYIWYSSGNILTTGLLEIPSEDFMRRHSGPEGWINRVNAAKKLKGEPLLEVDMNNNGIPNGEFGSDHLLIAAGFDLLNPQNAGEFLPQIS